MHNIYCNSFEEAISLLGKDRAKQLLKYCNIEFDTSIEYKYSSAYKQLFLSCMDIILAKYKRKQDLLREHRQLTTDLIDYAQRIIDSDTLLFNKIVEKCLPQELDIKNTELLSLRLSIASLVLEEMNSFADDERFKLLKARLDLFDSKKMNEYFKANPAI